VASSPANATALSLLANTALLQGRYADARRDLLRSLAVDPFTPRAHERLARIALEVGEPAEALHELDRERSLPEDDPTRDLLAGRAHRRLGDLARAREAWERVLARAPGNAEARDSLAATRGAAPR
jgi:tetratricopeptide (TPR) repeat protein